ncbi:MAG: NAD(+) synthase [Defluviitaleaceae bacterium]|nr:NAD(+) synthase [Defluviitaleaceae bacterium]
MHNFHNFHNFIHVSAAVPKLVLGNPVANEKEIIKIIKDAHEKGLHVLVLPELCLCGVTCGDLFFQPTLINKCQQAIAQIEKETEGTTVLAFVGAPILIHGKLYNCMVAISGGYILAKIAKHPTIEQTRWFSTPKHREKSLFSMGNTTLEIIQPTNESRFSKAQIIIDPWAVPINAMEDKVAQAKALGIGRALIQVGPGMMESSTDMVYNGHSIIAENGKLLAKGEEYSQNTTTIATTIDIDMLDPRYKPVGKKAIFVKGFEEKPAINLINRKISSAPFVLEKEKLAVAIKATQAALVRRILHVGAKKAIVGVSGGVDSTLALITTVEAFKMMGKDPKDVIAITMPGFGTSNKTYSNATNIIKATGASFKEISIVNAVNQHFDDIGLDSAKKDITYENAQARERTQILMDIANMENGLVVGSGGMSENALGFSTYGGDHISMYNVNGGLPKTLIIAMLRHIQQTNDTLSQPLEEILTTPISPELLPPTDDGQMSQKTEELIGSYLLNDFFLYYTLKNIAPKKILFLAGQAFENLQEEEIKNHLQKFYKRFFTNQYKRSCATDGPAVIGYSLSPRGGYIMPSDMTVQAWLEDID